MAITKPVLHVIDTGLGPASAPLWVLVGWTYDPAIGFATLKTTAGAQLTRSTDVATATAVVRGGETVILNVQSPTHTNSIDSDPFVVPAATAGSSGDDVSALEAMTGLSIDPTMDKVRVVTSEYDFGFDASGNLVAE